MLQYVFPISQERENMKLCLMTLVNKRLVMN